ncbi:Renin receptor [Halotydeus destructor]|nr:Renin receptor [Halotydeus destructor]
MFSSNFIAWATILGCFKSILADEYPIEKLNLAHPYASDFHVAAALIFISTIIIVLSVFGISLAMWNMDPGRDSIIYRMTSQRMKKDQ